MSEKPGECDVTYKVLLLGESGVGKSSLIRALTGSTFSHDMLTTVGIDYVKVPFIVDGVRVHLQIWDTAGQERFRSMTKFQYRYTKGLLLVYDITNRQTYETLGYWINSIEQDVEKSNKEPIPIIIIGNKSDMEDKRTVSTKEGKMVAEKNFLPGFFETSACVGANVQECFQCLAHAITEIFHPHLMGLYSRSTTPPKPGQSTMRRSPDSSSSSSSSSSSAPTRGKRQPIIKLTKSSKPMRRCQCKSSS